jgi:prohibitin 2
MFNDYGPTWKFWATLIGGIFIVILFFVLSPFGVVNAGERGVRTRFGAVTGEVLGEGLYWRIPLVESVKKLDVRVQKEEAEADAASKDLQTVSAKVAVNFNVEPRSVAKLYQEVGIRYKENLIAPALQETLKSSTAKFTAEELITKREEVKNVVVISLRDKLAKFGIVVVDFNIVNFDFSKSFNEAIESKVSAEQNALASKNKLEQVKYEAEQEIARAKGKAESIRVEAQALKDNPEVATLRAIEKWSGNMPTYYGGGTLPFINVK